MVAVTGGDPDGVELIEVPPVPGVVGGGTAGCTVVRFALPLPACGVAALVAGRGGAGDCFPAFPAPPLPAFFAAIDVMFDGSRPMLANDDNGVPSHGMVDPLPLSRFSVLIGSVRALLKGS